MERFDDAREAKTTERRDQHRVLQCCARSTQQVIETTYEVWIGHNPDSLPTTLTNDVSCHVGST
jgi:hypothetical protein